MEVLNQNQRASALWRIVALGILILALIGTILFSTHQAYATRGNVGYDDLKEKYDRESKIWKGTKKDLENKNNALRKELKDCKDALQEPDQKLVICERDLESKISRVDELEKDLTRCRADLAAEKNY